MSDKLRTIIIGDIHGCLDEFNELLKIIDYKSPNIRIICVGDLIDRGPDSAGVVRRCRELKIETCCGNHEYKYLKWYKSVGSRGDVYDKINYYSRFSEEDINYIFQMPTYIKLENTIIVHAGLKPGISLSDQSKDDLMYLRYTDAYGRFLSLKKISKIGKEEAGAHFWTEFWRGPESVVYGHNVHSMTDPLIEEVCPGVTCYGLDTGVCFGGRLTAMILETKEIVQVQAKREYYQAKFAI